MSSRNGDPEFEEWWRGFVEWLKANPSHIALLICIAIILVLLILLARRRS